MTSPQVLPVVPVLRGGLGLSLAWLTALPSRSASRSGLQALGLVLGSIRLSGHPAVRQTLGIRPWEILQSLLPRRRNPAPVSRKGAVAVPLAVSPK